MKYLIFMYTQVTDWDVLFMATLQVGMPLHLDVFSNHKKQNMKKSNSSVKN